MFGFTPKRSTKWQGKEGEMLERGVLQEATVEQWQQYRHQAHAGAERFEVAFMVQVGAQEIDVFAGDKIMSKLLHQLTVIPGKRKKVDLEQAAQVPEIVIHAFVACIKNIPFGMGNHRLKAFYLEVKQLLFEVEGRGYKGKFHQQFFAAEREQRLVGFEHPVEMLIHKIFCSRPYVLLARLPF